MEMLMNRAFPIPGFARRLLCCLCLVLLTALVGSHPVEAQSSPVLPTSFILETVRANGKSMPYTVWLPPDHSSTQQWPVILVLNGSAQVGADGMLPVLVGLAPQLWQHPERFPCLVVNPELPSSASNGWSNPWNDLVLQALEAVVKKYGGDRNRLYLTGLSQGGNGAWTIASDHPQLFAAAMPIAGYVTAASSAPNVVAQAEAKVAQALKSLPLWVFHGEADTSVSPVYDRQLVALIQAEGNPNIRYTEYKGVGHDAWDLAYGDPKVIEWLLAQKR
jgi:predicted peptidase